VDGNDDRHVPLLLEEPHRFRDVLRFGKVRFRQHDELMFPIKSPAVRDELAADRAVGMVEVLVLERHAVCDDARALDMPQELVPESPALCRALDQTGNVGEYEFAEHAEVRFERRERVRADARTRRGQLVQKARLARVRQADQPHIDDEPQLDREVRLFPRTAGSRLHRRNVGRRTEHVVPASARTAVQDQLALPWFREIEHLAGALVLHVRPDWDVQHEVLSLAPLLSRGLAVVAVLRAELAVPAEPRQRRKVGHGLEVHAASPSPVAAGRPALRRGLLMTPPDDAVAALSRLQLDLYLVDECHGWL